MKTEQDIREMLAIQRFFTPVFRGTIRDTMAAESYRDGAIRALEWVLSPENEKQEKHEERD